MIALHAYLVLRRLRGEARRPAVRPGAGRCALRRYGRRCARWAPATSPSASGSGGWPGFYGRIAAYQRGLAKRAVREALRRNLYGTVSPSPEELEFMANYLARRRKHSRASRAGDRRRTARFRSHRDKRRGDAMKEPAAVTPEFSRRLPADTAAPNPARLIDARRRSAPPRPALRPPLARSARGLPELSRGKGEVIRLDGHFDRRCRAELRRHPGAGAGPCRGRFRHELHRLGQGPGGGRSDRFPRRARSRSPRGLSTWAKPWPSSWLSPSIPIRGPRAPVWRLWRRPRRWRARGRTEGRTRVH